MKDPLKTVNMIRKQFVKDIKRDVRELVRIVPHSVIGTVKSEGQPDEPVNDYDVFFENLYKTEGLQEAIDEGKTVLVTLKEVDRRWFVIKKEIRTPNVEIPESSLEEQQEETEAFSGY